MKKLSRILINLLVGGIVLTATSLCSSTNLKTTNLPYYQNKKIVETYLGYQKSREDSSKLYIKIKHEIHKGDTFSKIARLYGTTVENVQASNLDKEAKKLEIGSYLEFDVEKKFLRGYIPPTSEEDIEKNKKYVQERTPEEFSRDRETFGKNLSRYLGIRAGEFEYNENKIIENFEKLKPLISKYSKKYDVDYKIIVGICKQESGFRQFTASRTGSYGACGQTKETYSGENYLAGLNKQKTKTNPFNLEQHIESTVEAYKNYENLLGSKKLALASYNQGFGRVSKALKKVARKRGYNFKNSNTPAIVNFLKETGKGDGGFVEEVLQELNQEGKKYPSSVIKQINWLSEKNLL
jgi:LysM repeat protein